jgi:hypothetical protein
VKIELKRDWSEFLSVLIARRVKFVLVGGHAVAGHGEPRFTEDLDVFVEPSLANARRLARALKDFGLGTALPPLSASPSLGPLWRSSASASAVPFGVRPRYFAISSCASRASADAVRGCLR